MIEDRVAYTRAPRDAGLRVAGAGLHAPDVARTVRVRDGEVLLSDAPLAEVKEHIIGFYLLETPDIDGAIRWAARVPNAGRGGRGAAGARPPQARHDAGDGRLDTVSPPDVEAAWRRERAGIVGAQAAGIIVAGTTAALILTRAARVSPGDTVLVPGAAGGVGSFAVLIAKLRGAGTVIGLASTASKRDTARALGADHVLDPTDPGWPDRVREITGGRGVDVALDAAGGDNPDRTLRVLAPFGTAVVHGLASGTPGRLADDTLARLLHDPAENQTVMAFHLGGWFGGRPEQAGEILGELVGMIASGAVRVHAGATYPLRAAARVHRLLADRAATGTIVLEP